MSTQFRLQKETNDLPRLRRTQPVTPCVWSQLWIVLVSLLGKVNQSDRLIENETDLSYSSGSRIESGGVD